VVGGARAGWLVMTQSALESWRTRGDAPARIERAGVGRIASAARPDRCLAQFHGYCLGLVRRTLVDEGLPLDVVFGDLPTPPAFRTGRTVRLGLQCEHTLVKPAGRDAAGAPAGGIPLPGAAGTYLVRIAGRERLRAFDRVIDYSLPNLANIASCPLFAEHLARSVHVSPLLGGPAPAVRTGGRRGVVTTFTDPRQPRRRELLARLAREGIGVRNVTGVYEERGLRRLYGGAEVVVNVRQTDHHDTLEELRVLPALLCGAIVVSEDAPLRSLVPYERFVIWADYDRIPAAVRGALADNARLRRRILEDPTFHETVLAMESANRRSLLAALQAPAGQSVLG
jgi:hypothetical protein